MIELRNITKSFGTLRVLKGIDLDIQQGEVVSIVGPSGAGKTTLLQIMGTLDAADGGTVVINGTDVTQLSQKQLARFRNRQIGFVFQFHQLLPEFTALENVMIPALIGGVNHREARKRAEELLAFMGLSDRASHKPAQLSGGEKQRVAVARALVNKPAVVLADEPSGSLDSANKAELHQLFFNLRDQFGQTFVIVTHDESLAAQTDRTIHLRDGLVIDPDEAVKADIDKAFETSDNTEDPEPAVETGNAEGSEPSVISGLSGLSGISEEPAHSTTSDEPTFTPLPDIAPERRDPLSPENTSETFLA